jgi:DNA modification methylase
MNESQRTLKVEYLPLVQLIPHARNPRTHSAKQVRQIAESMKKLGFNNPILIDQNRGVVAGHGRLLAAKLLGMSHVPTICLDQMSETQKRAYILADNRLAQNAGWDRELLALELSYITELEIDFDLTITGFETAEIDLLLLKESGSCDEAEQVPEVDRSKPSVTRVGDLWILGPHRLLCADSTDARAFEYLLDGEQAEMIFIDPPYNVPIDGNVSGLGQIKHREFAMASGEMSEAQFIAFLNAVSRNLITHSVDGSIHFVCMDWRHCFAVLSAARDVYAELKNLCVWNKDNGGMGSFYRSKHELVFVFKNGTGPHINNVELGRYGRNRTNVWDYPGMNSPHQGRLEELAMHPTVKPVALIADAILDCSKRRGIILDCFGGSGTTLIAAQKTGRRGYLMEIDPAYVDVAIKRFQKACGIEAIHASSERTFAEIERDLAGSRITNQTRGARDADGR